MAKLLQAGCNGQHEHERLEAPLELNRQNLILYQNEVGCKYAQDSLHMQIPAMFWQCEDNIKVSCRTCGVQ